MEIEYEASFPNVDKDEIRNRLKKVGAQLIRPEFLQKRLNFDLPAGARINGSWARVRDEGDRITMSYKLVNGSGIGDQNEICLVVDNYGRAVEFLRKLGCEEKAYQETTRELWILEDVEITIDEWPFLEPFVEIEGKSEDDVRTIAGKIGFNYADAVFGAADELYNIKYGIDRDVINNTKHVTFSGENPFLKHL